MDLATVLMALPIYQGEWRIPVTVPGTTETRQCILKATDIPDPWAVLRDYERAVGLCMSAFGITIDGPEAVKKALESLLPGA